MGKNKLQSKTRSQPQIYINAQIEQIQIKINNIVLVFQLQMRLVHLTNIYNKYIGSEIKKKEYVPSYYKQYLFKIKKLDYNLKLVIPITNLYMLEIILKHLKWKFKTDSLEEFYNFG
jgi:hypothetical protein